MERDGQQSQRPEESDFGELAWTRTILVIRCFALPTYRFLLTLKLPFQNIKEQNRSLERSYKELDRPSQGLSGSIKKPRRCEIGARSSPSSFPEEGHAGASPTGSDVDKERQRRANVIAKWKEVRGVATPRFSAR